MCATASPGCVLCHDGLTDSLGQIKSGQEIHYSGSGWVQGVVVMHVEVAKDDGRAM